jgi:K+-transporting ATPase KdpF subunit
MSAGPAVTTQRRAIMVAVYLLALIVVFLVVYLFYAVINPERF